MCGHRKYNKQGNDRRTQSRDASTSVRSPESRDLAKDNLDRVAASAVQLQAVLLKDPGILVELKRWVANEATNSGQIVDDESLSDQAIFDRLESDVAFRSIATRLVQRYGYLLPSVNPESEIAKEQDLVMKERVRRLAARQEKADQDSMAAEEAEKNPEQRQSRIPRTICDPQSQTNCNDTSSSRGRQRGNSLQDESRRRKTIRHCCPIRFRLPTRIGHCAAQSAATMPSLADIHPWNRLRLPPIPSIARPVA